MVRASSAKYLDTVQPDWDDLPLACELLELRWREPDDDLRVLAQNRGAVGSSKIQGVIRLLEALDLLDEDDLTGRGRWLAESYDPLPNKASEGRDWVLE